MKHLLHTFCAFLVCFFSIEAYAQFNPGNPPEPESTGVIEYATVTFVVTPTDGGSVNLSSGNKYEVGSEINLRAYTKSGFSFVSWTIDGDVVSRSSYFTYTVQSGETTIVANFIYNPSNPDEPESTQALHVLSLQCNPSDAGSFNVAKRSTVDEGEEVYLSAYAKRYYTFQNWTKDNTIVSSQRSFYFTMPDHDVTLVANYVFNYDPYNPDEPEQTESHQLGVYASSVNTDAGTLVYVPIFLENVASADELLLNFTLPRGFSCGSSIQFTSRCQGAQSNISLVSGNSYSLSVQCTSPFTGTNGQILSIPVNIPDSAREGVSYNFILNSAQIIQTNGSSQSASLRSAHIHINNVYEDGLYSTFTYDQYNNRVQFVNQSSESALSYSWDFGDGQTSTERNPFHSYASSGLYTVSLTIAGQTKTSQSFADIYVNPSANWTASSLLYLTTQRNNAKCFLSLDELFRNLNTIRLNGDIQIEVNSGTTFDFDLSSQSLQLLTNLANKLDQSNNRLLFSKSGTNSQPILLFGNTTPSVFSQSVIQNYIDFCKNIDLNNVITKLWNIEFIANIMSEITEQTVCSGDMTKVIDISQLSSQLSFNWHTLSIPAGLNGAVDSGSRTIPQMTLTHSASETRTVSYWVTANLGTAVFYEFETQINVRPSLVGLFTKMSPVDNFASESLDVELSWNSIANAKYDLYLWDLQGAKPETPFVANTDQLRWSLATLCQFGHEYKWWVRAFTDCNEQWSDTLHFSVNGLPNLHVSSLTNSDAVADENLQISWTVVNDGAYSTGSAEWYDYIWLVKNIESGTRSQSDDDVLFLAKVHNPQALSPGQSYTNSVNVKVAPEYYGAYYLLVMSDMYDLSNIDWSPVGGTAVNPYQPNQDSYFYLFGTTSSYYNQVYEQGEPTNRSDNFFYKLIDIAPASMPDLQVPAVSVAVSNPSFNQFDATDYLRGDLYPSAITAAGLRFSPDFYSGKRIRVTATIKNMGRKATPRHHVRIGVYLSDSPIPNDGIISTLAEWDQFIDLAPNASVDVSDLCYIPYEAYGNLYIQVFADLDDEINEFALSDNNWGVSPLMLVKPLPNADMVPYDLSVPTIISPNKNFEISYKVKNIGQGLPFYGGWYDGIYLSKTNRGLDATAKRVKLEHNAGSYHSPAYNAPNGGGPVYFEPEQYSYTGDNYTKKITIDPGDLEGGYYYLYVKADDQDQILEFDGENNNVICSDSIFVSIPNLTVEWVSVSADTIHSAETVAFAWKLTNTGNAPIEGEEIEDAIFISKRYEGIDSTYFTSFRHTLWLGVGESKIIRKNYTIPRSTGLDGIRFIAVYTNYDEYEPILEGDMSDNFSSWKRQWFKYVKKPVPNVSDVSVYDIECKNEVVPGELIPIQFEVYNSGNTAVLIEPSIDVLLAYDTETGEDTVSCPVSSKQGSLLNLAPDSSCLVSLLATIPNTMVGGQKELLVYVDKNNVMKEVKTYNNYDYKYISVKGNLPNLVVQDVACPDTITTSTKTNISWKLRNTGTWKSGVSVTRVYLSSDTIYDYRDVQLAILDNSGLNAGAHVIQSSSINIADKYFGRYYLIIRPDADCDVEELYEKNKEIIYPVFLEQSTLPNLVVTSVVAPTKVAKGESATISVTVRNNGSAPTKTNMWSDNIYLSNSTILDTYEAELLGSKTHVGYLAAGASYTFNYSVYIPSDADGNYRLFVLTDANEVVYETNETDNKDSAPVFVQNTAEQPSDISAISVSAPANIKVGQEIKISYTVQNKGQYPAEGILYDAIYLSTDNQLDATDILVGSVSGRVTMSPNNSIVREVYGKISSVAEGNYYVIIRTNSTNTLSETSLDNNVIVSKSTSAVQYNPLAMSGSPSVNTIGFYKLVVPSSEAGKTLSISLSASGSSVSTGLYVAYNKGVSTAQHDFHSSILNNTKQEVIIPNIQEGTYYVLAQDNSALFSSNSTAFNLGASSSVNGLRMTLQTKVLEFGATSLSIDEGGTGGWTSTDISGALFDSIMDFRLVQGTTVIPAEAVTVHGSTQARVTFNLNDANVGKYDIISELADGTVATLPQGFTVIPGTSASLGVKINAPQVVRANSYAPFSIIYANGGTVDCEIRKIVVKIDHGYLATDIQGLNEHNSTITLDLDTQSDGRGGYMSIPPGVQKVVNLFLCQTSSSSNISVYIYL